MNEPVRTERQRINELLRINEELQRLLRQAAEVLRDYNPDSPMVRMIEEALR